MCSGCCDLEITLLVTLKVMAATKKTGLIFIVLFMLPFLVFFDTVVGYLSDWPVGRHIPGR